MPDGDGQPFPARPLGPSGPTSHPLPRRAAPEESVTLRHHRLARDAAAAAAAARPSGDQKTDADGRRGGATAAPESSLVAGRAAPLDRHNSSGSDPKNWFDESNENPTGWLDANSMDGKWGLCLGDVGG